MALVPMVLKRTSDGERSMDLFSRLLDDRIIMLTEEFETGMASIIVGQLLYLNSLDNSSPITMYINSPGGAVSDMWSIVDTMNFIKAPVHTICIGMAASCGSLVLAAGEKEHRYILPHGKVMIHQPSGGARGQITDIEIAVKEGVKEREATAKLIADATGRTVKQVLLDLDRDYYMNAKEALAYGIIDKIIEKQD